MSVNSETCQIGCQRLWIVGMRRWKRALLRPLLVTLCHEVRWISRPERLLGRLAFGDAVLLWGSDVPGGVRQAAQQASVPVWHLEDGFIRSVGLGANMVPPLSIVVDQQGLYFDSTKPSDLEALLIQSDWSSQVLSRAADVRAEICRHGITKYNIEPRTSPDWPKDKLIVLVTGQVEDDASIRLGGGAVRTNAQLLVEARRLYPDAFIVFKPHPDVFHGYRKGQPLVEYEALADYIEARCSVVACIEVADVVCVMTSLSGFDALLRDKHVVTFGAPFYAGWGLTEDHANLPLVWQRRQRRLTLDQLVAGALLEYPLYWHPEQQGWTDCETVLTSIVRQRQQSETQGVSHQRPGFWRRQWRKCQIICKQV